MSHPKMSSNTPSLHNDVYLSKCLEKNKHLKPDLTTLLQRMVLRSAIISHQNLHHGQVIPPLHYSMHPFILSFDQPLFPLDTQIPSHPGSHKIQFLIHPHTIITRTSLHPAHPTLLISSSIPFVPSSRLHPTILSSIHCKQKTYSI